MKNIFLKKSFICILILIMICTISACNNDSKDKDYTCKYFDCSAKTQEEGYCKNHDSICLESGCEERNLNGNLYCEAHYVELAKEKFEIVLSVTQYDTTGYYSGIAYGTSASNAIKNIEDYHKACPSNHMIKQMYYYNTVVGYMYFYNLSPSMYSSYKSEASYYARLIDSNYDGPYCEEILALAKKYS